MKEEASMTTKEKLILMQDIKRKNDIAWSKYAKQSRPGWTWDMDVKKPFRPFGSFGGMCILTICVPVLLVLLLKMA
jgi:hypothetical protein